MSDSTNPSHDTRHIRVLQRIARCSLIGACIVFVLLPLDALAGYPIPQALMMLGCLSGVFVPITSLVVLSSAKCPQCGNKFTGSTEEDVDPVADMFAATCRYCGHPR